MLVQLSGTRDGQEWPPPGGLVRLPDVEAAEYAAAGFVEAAAAAPPPRTATVPTKPAPKAKRP